MNKKTQIFQISSKFHRLNRRKAGIFSCMRSARVDWGKSHRQIIKFSRGLRFRAKIYIFSTRKHKKNSFFELIHPFRAAAPPDAQQNCRRHAKYAFSKSSFNCASNYAVPQLNPHRQASKNSKTINRKCTFLGVGTTSRS